MQTLLIFLRQTPLKFINNLFIKINLEEDNTMCAKIERQDGVVGGEKKGGNFGDFRYYDGYMERIRAPRGGMCRNRIAPLP